MTLPTHIAFHWFLNNILAFRPNIKGILFSITGLLIPDISNPYSLTGKALGPLNRYIFEKYGHRTLTHSWIVILITAVISLLLRNLTHGQSMYLLFGAVSHILLDMLNIAGVQFLWPDKVFFVIGNDSLRIGTGSKSETRFFTIILILAMITTPLSVYGYQSVIRFFAMSHRAATEEYKDIIDRYEAYAVVKLGINRISQQVIKDKTFRIIAAMPKKLTLVEDENGRRFTIGQVEEAIIETKKIYIVKGNPIHVLRTKFKCSDSQNPWKYILNKLSEPYSYVNGYMYFYDRVEFKHEPEIWEGIEIEENNTESIVRLEYSGLAAVSKLKNYKLKYCSLVFRSEVSPEGTFAPLIEPPEVKEKNISFFVSCQIDELLIKEGDFVKKDQIIVRRKQYNEILKRIEALKVKKELAEVERQRLETLTDRTIALKQKIKELEIQIKTQTEIINSLPENLKIGEMAKLNTLIDKKKMYESILNEVVRARKEYEEYLKQKAEALEKMRKREIEALKASLEGFTVRSPVTGRVVSITQKSPRSFYIVMEVQNER